MTCIVLAIATATSGALLSCAAPSQEQRPPSVRTAFANSKDNPGALPGLLDQTQGTEPLMQPSKPERCGGFGHPIAAPARLQA
jgi:hypothetical protein